MADAAPAPDLTDPSADPFANPSASPYASLTVGDPAPWFRGRCTSNPDFAFDTVAGRYVVLGFFGSAGDGPGRRALAAVEAHRALFDDDRACFFGVSADPDDEREVRVREAMPGLRHFWDFDGRIARLYGVAPRGGDAPEPGATVGLRRRWLVLDPTLRVAAVFPLAEDAALFAYLAGLPPPDRFAGFEVPPPILVLPDVFEPALCRDLIERYDRHGGAASGFMRDVGGRTVQVQDPGHKMRRDHVLADPDLIRVTQGRMLRRVAPELRRIFAFEATRMERHLVGCYAADDGAHFRAHRDNTTKGTAHRRFAVSINLNGDFEGGAVSFPEYGRRGYTAPPGGAVVFPCALLHAVSRVTRGRRYAFLPFLYDEAAARVREANSGALADGSRYRADPGAA